MMDELDGLLTHLATAQVDFAANWLRDLMLEHHGRMPVVEIYELARHITGPKCPLGGLHAAERRLSDSGICYREITDGQDQLVFPAQEQMAAQDLLHVLIDISDNCKTKGQQ